MMDSVGARAGGDSIQTHDGDPEDGGFNLWLPFEQG